MQENVLGCGEGAVQEDLRLVRGATAVGATLAAAAEPFAAAAVAATTTLAAAAVARATTAICPTASESSAVLPDRHKFQPGLL